MELLTGDCKKKFEEWRILKYEELISNNKTEWSYYGYSVFRELSFSMQYGVLVDFFDSVGINIEDVKYSLFLGYGFNVKDRCPETSVKKNLKALKTRSEARKQAIQKANELFNNK